MRIAWQNVKRTGKLVDTSVLIKWFHSEGELPHARALRSAHVAGELDAHILDLRPTSSATCSFALRWEPDDVADQLGDPRTVLGPALVMTADCCDTRRHSRVSTRCRFMTPAGRQPRSH
jgi:hypothetical protein